MSEFWTTNGAYRAIEYASEAELESVILDIQTRLFGPHRVYLDVKRKIRRKGGQRNIPDGYLIDLHGSRPQLYVVENELERHDPLRHIAVQVLQFSLSFESDPILIKSILMDALNDATAERERCEAQIQEHGTYRNLDHLLEWLVFESGFRALVIIDRVPEGLETVLLERFRFPVEVMYLAMYEGEDGQRAYKYEPFLADVLPAPSGSDAPRQQVTDPTDIDTVVVPARPGGFERTFLGEHRWHAIRVHASMRDHIKWIAAYQVAPTSAITHVPPVRSIEPWEDSGKVVIKFAEAAHQIDAIGLVSDGRIGGLQNLRYTAKSHLDEAQTLDDLW